MADHQTHEHSDHVHGPNCGHTAVKHDDHVDYLHDGHLHHKHDGNHDEHSVPISDKNPDVCTPNHQCGGHDAGHHDPSCGHEAVPHGDQTDYLVDDHLSHPHGDHSDDHSKLDTD